MATLVNCAHRVDVPAVARGFLPDADYADAFRLPAVGHRAACDWARHSLGTGVSLLDRIFGRVVWHGVLGFDLAEPGTSGTLAGWRIAVDRPDLAALSIDGRLMTGRIVFAVSPENVTWTTLLRFHRPPAERIWAVAQHVHRALAGPLLARAARSFAP